ncbi:Arf GTPase arf1 [Mucor velutinosus]|uniref:Arf GTPase arf1 n=1 Tax=Mucor velutinosus TaxID=708070 RepID=A0AAN7D853_9FUNG|nr:Arf GTPase arf1 [Mucor velutinosus]
MCLQNQKLPNSIIDNMKFTLLITTALALFATASTAMPTHQNCAIANSSAPSSSSSGYDIHLKSDTAFCSFMPPHPGDNVGATENNGIPFCTNATLGGQVFPQGFIKTAHFLNTTDYAQVTGTIDRAAYQLDPNDGGGQYDNMDIKNVTCNGYKFFVNLIEPDANVFCIRCCENQSDCNLGISTYGCERIVPGDYS